MRFGVYVPTSGPYDVPALVELAHEAEHSGWDGFFIWDHVLWSADGSGLDDPTVALAAIALRTTTLRFGALVTPLTRRKPWKVAKETATLDRLSGGRLVFGTGLGGRADLEPVGDSRSPKELAAVLDEGLDVLAALWSADPITHHGTHFDLTEARVAPAPLQSPRIPVWVAGSWPNKAPMRRAARWDGVFPLRRGSLLEGLSPAEMRECGDYIAAHRTENSPFDLVALRTTSQSAGARDTVACEEAGATWLLRAVNPLEESLPDFRAAVRAGPPG